MILVLRISAIVLAFLSLTAGIIGSRRFSKSESDRFRILKRLNTASLPLLGVAIALAGISALMQVFSAVVETGIERIEIRPGRLVATVAEAALEPDLKRKDPVQVTGARDYFRAGRQDLSAGRFAHAVANFEKSVTKVPTVAGFLSIGVALQALSRLHDAKRALLSGLALLSDDTPADIRVLLLTTLGGVEEELGEFDSAGSRVSAADGLRSSLNDQTVWADVQNLRGRLAADKGDVSSALRHYREALNLYGASHDDLGQAATWNNIGNAHLDKGELDDAVRAFTSALEFYRARGDDLGRIRALNNTGNALAEKGYFDQAMRSYSEALAIARSNGNEEEQANALNNMGEIKREQGSGGEALALERQALDIVTRLGLRDKRATILTAIGNAYYSIGDFDNAIASYTTALTLYRDDDPGKAGVVGNLADAFRRQGRFAEALTQANGALVLFERADDQVGLANTYTTIGALHSDKKDWAHAEKAFHTALTWAHRAGSASIQTIVLISLSDVYRQMHRLDEAVASAKAAITLAASLPAPQLEALAQGNLGMAHLEDPQQSTGREELSEAIAKLQKLGVPESDYHEFVIRLKSTKRAR